MFKKQDLTIFAATIILSLLGVFTLISTNLGENGEVDLGGIVAKQIIFVAVGYLAYFTLVKIDYTYLKHIQIGAVLYLLTIALLVATLIWGPVINNVQRWLIVGGVQIQASEIAKVVVIIVTAGLMSHKHQYNEWRLAAASFLLVLPICALIYIEPHGAMSLIVLALWFFVVFTFLDHQLRNILLLAIGGSISLGIILISLDRLAIGIGLIILAVMLFIFSFYSREQWRKFFVVALCGGILLGMVGSISWSKILKDYQKDRIEVFLNPEGVDDDKAFNVNQAKIAIGSGGIWGKGFGYGTQSRLKFLPEHQTDFIFATYAEQFGLLGSMFLLTVYGYVISKVLWLGVNMREDFFGSILAIGFGVKILVEVFINIGTNTGAVPATGIPLPLLSAGGSITIMTFVTLGIVQSIVTQRRNEPKSSDLVDNSELLL